ncbi:APC family permease [Amycolatopsis sp. TRM77291]
MHSRPHLSPAAPAKSRVDTALAAAKLSDWSITTRAIAATTPMAIVGGVIPSGIAATGGNAFPILFVAIAFVFGLFSVSYLAASRRLPPADASGGFYSLVSRGLGRPAGVGAGWIAIVTYTALTIGLYGVIGSIVTPLLSDLFAVEIPWQLIAVVTVLLVGASGLANIAASTRVVVILVSCELLVIIAVTIANWFNPTPGHQELSSLDPRLLMGAVAVTIARLALGMLGYVGAELTVVHTQDARWGYHGVARATLSVITILTLLYVFCSAGLTITLGPEGVTDAARSDPSGLFVATAQSNLGTIPAIIVQIIYATSLLAGAIPFHGATSRYAYFLGRNRTAPAALGKQSRGYGTPIVASVSQTVLALVAITVVSAFSADPVQVLFYIGGSAGAVGILLLLAMSALSTVIIFLRPSDHEASSSGWIVAAALASTVLLGGLVSTVLANLGILLGVPEESGVPNIVRISYLVVFALGAARALWLRQRRPDAYVVIGTAKPVRHATSHTVPTNSAMDGGTAERTDSWRRIGRIHDRRDRP